MLSIVSSAARTVSGNQIVLPGEHIEQYAGGVFVLDVTVAATAVGDTLDVYMQSSIDDSAAPAYFDDFIHFTQVLGNGGAKRFIASWIRDYVPTSALKPPADATLAAGVQQGPVGLAWRAKWVIAGAGPSFTFALNLYPYRLTGR